MNDLIATAISCEADEYDRLALRELARSKKTSVAKLVRNAIDKEYGRDLAPLRAFFVASDRQRNDETVKR